MKKIIYLLLTASCLLLAGCKTKEVIKYVPVVVRHDSIVTNTVHDTLLTYPKQKQQVVTSKPSHLETDFAFSDALVDSTGYLHHSIQNKEQIPGKIITNKTVVHDSIPVPYPVKGDPYPVEKKLSWMQKTLIGAGILFSIEILALILFLIYKLKKTLTL